MATTTLSIPNTTFLSSAQPAINFSIYPLIFTGTDVNYQNCIGLLQVDLSSLPVTQVDSAMLQLAVVVKTGAAPSPVVVNTVMEPFNVTTVTYNTRPAFTPASSSVNVAASDLYTTVQINITSLVNSWLNGTVANNGIALTNSDGSTLVEFGTNNIVYEPYFPKLILTYSSTPTRGSALDFSYAQLAHVIQQIIMFYPESTVTVFTKGLSASTITGTPYQLFASPEGTYGGLFILLDNGQQQAIPLNSIAAIYTGDGTVYNPAFTYLTSPGFPAGYDTNIITAYYAYLTVGTDVNLYAGSNIHATGTVFKDEYGMVVLSDGSGNTPVFIPVIPITAVLPTIPPPPPSPAPMGQQGAKLPKITVEKSFAE